MKFQTNNIKSRQINHLGRQLAQQLDSGVLAIHPDISERLRIAREQAVSHRRVVVLQLASTVQEHPYSGELTLGGSWWSRFSVLAPLAVLVVGLVFISARGDEQQAHELADVDIELLTDELPPSAYVDSGFAKFLQLKGRE